MLDGVAEGPAWTLCSWVRASREGGGGGGGGAPRGSYTRAKGPRGKVPQPRPTIPRVDPSAETYHPARGPSAETHHPTRDPSANIHFRI